MTSRRENLQRTINNLQSDLVILSQQFKLVPDHQKEVLPLHLVHTKINTIDNGQDSSCVNDWNSQHVDEEDLSVVTSKEGKLVRTLRKLTETYNDCQQIQAQINQLRDENTQLLQHIKSLAQQAEDYDTLLEDFELLKESWISSEKIRYQQKTLITLLRSVIIDNIQQRNEIENKKKCLIGFTRCEAPKTEEFSNGSRNRLKSASVYRSGYFLSPDITKSPTCNKTKNKEVGKFNSPKSMNDAKQKKNEIGQIKLTDRPKKGFESTNRTSLPIHSSTKPLPIFNSIPMTSDPNYDTNTNFQRRSYSPINSPNVKTTLSIPRQVHNHVDTSNDQYDTLTNKTAAKLSSHDKQFSISDRHRSMKRLQLQKSTSISLQKSLASTLINSSPSSPSSSSSLFSFEASSDSSMPSDDDNPNKSNLSHELTHLNWRSSSTGMNKKRMVNHK